MHRDDVRTFFTVYSDRLSSGIGFAMVTTGVQSLLRNLLLLFELKDLI